MITTVTGKNQITIPAELARELDISPGTRLDWTKREAGVLVVKIIPNRTDRRKPGRPEDHHFCDFVGFPYPPQRNLVGLRLDETPKLFIIQTKQIVASSWYHTRADRVNANPLAWY